MFDLSDCYEEVPMRVSFEELLKKSASWQTRVRILAEILRADAGGVATFCCSNNPTAIAVKFILGIKE
jgi:hypothetical protein